MNADQGENRVIVPQLFKLLILFLTIPVTVATAERSFSKLKIIKSYLWSSLSQERLEGHAMLAIEKNAITSDIQERIIKDNWMPEDEQGFAVVKNAKRHNQEANSWEFQFGRISYTVITYCCSSIFATH